MFLRNTIPQNDTRFCCPLPGVILRRRDADEGSPTVGGEKRARNNAFPASLKRKEEREKAAILLAKQEEATDEVVRSA